MTKYKVSLLLGLIITFLIVMRVNAIENELPLFGKVIYLDPGHGGPDPGANYKDIYEKDINLEISKMLSDMLMERGAIVYLTREGDYDLSSPHVYLRKRSDLSRRARLINESGSDLYLSIHLNATSSTTWKGAQVFYDDVNDKNKLLGQKIQDSFKRFLGSRRKLKEVNNLYMYKDIDIPGVLLEVGFLSNTNERYLLRKSYYQKRIANAIIEGVYSYYGY